MSKYRAEYGEHGITVYEDDIPMTDNEIQETLNRLNDRLEISPQGDDQIDALEECIRQLRHQLECVKGVCKEADDYLNTNNQTRIDHGSILHGKFAEAWRDFDAHEHDGVACSPGCRGHHSHPCENCGRQWPVRIKEKD